MLDMALHNLRPNAEWRIDNDVLVWLDKKQTKPTEKEIEIAILELKNKKNK